MGFCYIGLFFSKKEKSKSANIVSITATTPSPIIEITWPEAISLLQECQVASVFQKRNLLVTLTGKNNRVYQTTEPKINDIFFQTDHLRSDCNDIITTITE